jgi:hypothetical protein
MSSPLIPSPQSGLSWRILIAGYITGSAWRARRKYPKQPSRDGKRNPFRLTDERWKLLILPSALLRRRRVLRSFVCVKCVLLPIRSNQRHHRVGMRDSQKPDKILWNAISRSIQSTKKNCRVLPRSDREPLRKPGWYRRSGQYDRSFQHSGRKRVRMLHSCCEPCSNGVRMAVTVKTVPAMLR